MLIKYKDRHSILIRAIAMVVVCLFIFNDIAFGLDLKTSAANSALAPNSRFKPAFILEPLNNGYKIKQDPGEIAKLAKGFPEDATFMALNLLIGQFLKDAARLSGMGVTQRGLAKKLEELKKSFERDLDHVELDSNNKIDFSRFRYKEMYLEANTVCLPYTRKDDGRTQILRYYLPDKNKIEFPDRVSIPIGNGAYAILEDPLEDQPNHDEGALGPIDRGDSGDDRDMENGPEEVVPDNADQYSEDDGRFHTRLKGAIEQQIENAVKDVFEVNFALDILEKEGWLPLDNSDDLNCVIARVDSAIKTLERYLPDCQTKTNMWSAAVCKNEIDEARKLLDKLKEIKPEDWDSWLEKGESSTFTGQEHVKRFKESDKPAINPSLTTLVGLVKTDLNAFLEKAKLAQKAGASSLHLYVFDPSYIETSDGKGNMDIFNADLVKKIISAVTIPIDVHLMVRPSTLGGVDKFIEYINGFIDNGASFVTVHLSAFHKDGLSDDDVRKVLKAIRSFKGKCAAAGLAVNPDENAKNLLNFKGDIDFPLIMTVVPGAGGKSFDERGLANLKILNESGIGIIRAADGGITDKTIGDVVKNGGKWLVVGSYFFGKGDNLKSGTEIQKAQESLIEAAGIDKQRQDDSNGTGILSQAEPLANKPLNGFGAVGPINTKERQLSLLHVGRNHNEFYEWLKNMIGQKKIKKGLPLILFDFHSDAFSYPEVNCGTWVYHALKKGYISKVIWVLPPWEKKLEPEFRQITERKCVDEDREEGMNIRWCYPDKLPKVKGEALVSFDFDFFSLARERKEWDKDVHRASENEIQELVDTVFAKLKEKKIEVAAFGLSQTGSPYTFEEQIPFIEKTLKERINQYENSLTADRQVGKEKAENKVARIGKFINAIENGKFQSGNIVDLRNLSPDTEIILVGDLHARPDNLDKILSEVMDKVRNKKAVLVILGDAVHYDMRSEYSNEKLKNMDPADPEINKKLADMNKSIEIMRKIMDLKVENPDNVYYILGNHDDPFKSCGKGRTDQSEIYRDEIKNKYGNEYLDFYKQFIKVSPIMLIANGLVATHAGPANDLSLDEIRNINKDDEKIKLMLWGRFDDSGCMFPGTYTEENIHNFLTKLGQPEAMFIVGHFPAIIPYPEWHAEVTENHHIIYAARDKTGYAVFKEGKIDFVDVAQNIRLPIAGEANPDKRQTKEEKTLAQNEPAVPPSGISEPVFVPKPETAAQAGSVDRDKEDEELGGVEDKTIEKNSLGYAYYDVPLITPLGAPISKTGQMRKAFDFEYKSTLFEEASYAIENAKTEINDSKINFARKYIAEAIQMYNKIIRQIGDNPARKTELATVNNSLRIAQNLLNFLNNPIPDKDIPAIFAKEGSNAKMIYDEDYQDAVKFLKEVGVNKGCHIIEVGNGNVPDFGFATAALGANYIAYEIERDMAERVRKDFEMWDVERFGGSARQVCGEFSSGKNSGSKDIKEHSQDMVLILTGGLSDPSPVSAASEVLREAMRVIKPGGRIVVGTYGMWRGHESNIADSVIAEVLAEPEWKGKVRIEYKGDVMQKHVLTKATICEVVFDSAARDKAEEEKRPVKKEIASEKMGQSPLGTVPIFSRNDGGLNLEREENVAGDLRDEIIILGDAVKNYRDEAVKDSNQKAYMFLGTSWITGYRPGTRQYKYLNNMIVAMRKLCKKKGVEFIDDYDTTIARKIRTIKRRNKNAKIFALTGKDTVSVIEKYMKMLSLENDANTFLAGVDNKNLLADDKDVTMDNYYRIAEMFFVMLEISRANAINIEAVKAEHEALGLTYINKNKLSFEPKAERFKYDILKNIYEIQKFA